jgi:hypothetical protein
VAESEYPSFHGQVRSKRIPDATISARFWISADFALLRFSGLLSRVRVWLVFASEVFHQQFARVDNFSLTARWKVTFSWLIRSLHRIDRGRTIAA